MWRSGLWSGKGEYFSFCSQCAQLRGCNINRYPIDESTWERKTSMANPTLLIRDFVKAAVKEGWDLDEDPNETVLLNDARKAGVGLS